MRTGAFTLGIVGGMIALVMGVFMYWFGGVGSSLGVQDSGVVMMLSVVIPVVGLVGAAIVKSQAVLGAVLMLLSSIALFLSIGLNCTSLLPGILLGLGGVLGLLSSKERTA